MIYPWGLQPYLHLSEDACRRVVRSEWKDTSSFPPGYKIGLLRITKAPIWEPPEGLPATVMALEFHAETTDEFAVANVRTIQTFAFETSVRKFQAVATPEDQEILKYASHLPWIKPRFVMWQVVPADGRRNQFLFDSFREDLVATEDYLYFITECGKAMAEFADRHKQFLDADNYYIGP